MGEWNEALNYLHFVARLKMQNVIWKLRFRGIFTTVNELEPTHCNTGRKKSNARERYLINSISKSNLIARKFLFPITGLLCFAGHCCSVQKTSSLPITNLLDGRGKNVWSIAFFGLKCQLIEDRVVVEWLNSDSTQKEEKESQIPFLRSKFSHRSRQRSESRRAKNEYKIPQIYTKKRACDDRSNGTRYLLDRISSLICRINEQIVHFSSDRWRRRHANDARRRRTFTEETRNSYRERNRFRSGNKKKLFMFWIDGKKEWVYPAGGEGWSLKGADLFYRRGCSLAQQKLFFLRNRKRDEKSSRSCY